MTQIRVDYHGLTVTGDLIEGAMQGDPSVPGGVDEIPPYIADIVILTPDGFDITDEFHDTDKIEAHAIKEVLG